MARFVFHVAFLLPILGQRELSFPVNSCPRTVHVCNVLSVLVFTNIQKISVVHCFIACVAIFPNEFQGEKALSKSLINNSRKYRMLFIRPSQETLFKDFWRVFIVQCAYVGGGCGFT